MDSGNVPERSLHTLIFSITSYNRICNFGKNKYRAITITMVLR